MPELDITSGIAEAESWLRRRIFQSFQDSPAGHIASLARMFGAMEPDSEADWSVAQNTERPDAGEWAQFEAACGQVRSGRAAA